MPNYVLTNIEFDPEYTNLIVEATRDMSSEVEGTDDNVQSFDFNRLIPMPKELNISAGSINDLCVCLYALDYPNDNRWKIVCDYYKKRRVLGFTMETNRENIIDRLSKGSNPMSIEDALELANTIINNIVNYGADTWYDWCIANWGTKWNACEAYISNGFISFQTAWAHPDPIIRKLSEMFPDCRFHISYADEDIGSNLGEYYIENGKYTDCPIKDEVAFARELWGYDDYEDDD